MHSPAYHLVSLKYLSNPSCEGHRWGETLGEPSCLPSFCCFLVETNTNRLPTTDRPQALMNTEKHSTIPKYLALYQQQYFCQWVNKTEGPILHSLYELHSVSFVRLKLKTLGHWLMFVRVRDTQSLHHSNVFYNKPCSCTVVCGSFWNTCGNLAEPYTRVLW